MSSCMYVCVRMCMYMCVYIRICIREYAYMCICVHVFIYVCVCEQRSEGPCKRFIEKQTLHVYLGVRKSSPMIFAKGKFRFRESFT